MSGLMDFCALVEGPHVAETLFVAQNLLATRLATLRVNCGESPL
jgi:hypothetical protein